MRFIRYKWKNQRPAQIRQFLLRLLPLLLILFLSGGTILIYRGSDLRSRLDEGAFEMATSRTVDAVNGYFSPLIEFMSSSLLWGDIGEIDSLGDTEAYISLLQTRIGAYDSVASLSLTDGQGKELDLLLEDNEWYVTDRQNFNSLTSMREEEGIEYISPGEETGLRISDEYFLPHNSKPGITMSLEPSGQNDGRNFTLSMDLPFDIMVDRLKHEGAVRDTHIFILMPSGDDFLFLPLSKLDELSARTGGEEAVEIGTSLDSSAEELILLLFENIPDSQSDDLRFRFDSEENTWLTQFHILGIGMDNLVIGTLVPLESLWTSQFAIPVQVLLLFLLGAAAFLGYRLVVDFLGVSRTPERIEELLIEEIGQGESFFLEFKSSLRWDYREDKLNKGLEEIIVKSVAAFSNAKGGSLLIGVADDGEILGLEKDFSVLRQEGADYYEIHLRNLLGSRYGVGYTSKFIAIDFPVIADREICRIRIRRGKQPLYTLVKTKSGVTTEKFFIRSGNTSQGLENPSEITNYILSRFSRWGFGKRLGDS